MRLKISLLLFFLFLFLSLACQGIFERFGATLYFQEPKEILPATKQQIAFVKETKQFGENILGIKPSKVFEVYSPDPKRSNLYILYWFPKGEIPEGRKDLFCLWGYKIYDGNNFTITLTAINSNYPNANYDKNGLEQFKKKLSEDGMDIFEREVVVNSTTKVITPLFLSLSQPNQAMLVFHEGCHNMIANLHLDGLHALHDVLEEPIASVVGYQGAIIFSRQKFGISSPQYLEAFRLLEDFNKKADLINSTLIKLKEIQRSGLSKLERMKKIEELMLNVSDDPRYKTWRRACLEPDSWDRIPPPEKLNSLFFVYFSAYMRYYPLVTAVYEKVNDPKEFIELIKKMPASSEEAVVEYLTNILQK